MYVQPSPRNCLHTALLVPLLLMLVCITSCPSLLASAGALWNRVVDAAKKAGVYRGQSVHSFRRGSMQHMEGLGVPRTEVAQRAKIKTPEVAARYFNKRRSHVKLAKQGRAAKAARLG